MDDFFFFFNFKIKMDEGVARFFTRFGGNLFIS